MAIYHLTVKIIGRSSGRSAVAAAAYRSGDILTNQYDGLIHDYSRKNWIEHTEIMLPPAAPVSFKDRSALWNSVELAEKSGNAQLAREVETALPKELNLEQQTALARAYIEQNFVSHGMCADFAIHNPPVTDSRGRSLDREGKRTHDPKQMLFNNPHLHIMLTMRPLSQEGNWQPKSQKYYLCRRKQEEKPVLPGDMKRAEREGWRKQFQYRAGRKKIWLTEESAAKKGLQRVNKNPKSQCSFNPVTAVWNSKDSLFKWRESWAGMCNQALTDHKINASIDHRSYEEQGINRISTVHLGPVAYQAKKRGQHTELGDLNREIARNNQFLDGFAEEIRRMTAKQTEHLKQTAAKLEGLRINYMAAAYEQLSLSAVLISSQEHCRDEAVIAKAYADSMEKIMTAIESLLKFMDIKKAEIRQCGPFQSRKRKTLIREAGETEKEIASLCQRRDDIIKFYKTQPSFPALDPEVMDKQRNRIRFLKERQSKINAEFWKLAEDHREQLKELKDLQAAGRGTWEAFAKERMQEHDQKNFNQDIWEKAGKQAPELSETEKDGIKNRRSHRR